MQRWIWRKTSYSLPTLLSTMVVVVTVPMLVVEGSASAWWLLTRHPLRFLLWLTVSSCVSRYNADSTRLNTRIIQVSGCVVDYFPTTTRTSFDNLLSEGRIHSDDVSYDDNEYDALPLMKRYMVYSITLLHWDTSYQGFTSFGRWDIMHVLHARDSEIKFFRC